MKLRNWQHVSSLRASRRLSRELCNSRRSTDSQRLVTVAFCGVRLDAVFVDARMRLIFDSRIMHPVVLDGSDEEKRRLVRIVD